MLHWILTFLILTLIAGILGFTGIAIAASDIAKMLFVVFMVLFFASLFLQWIKQLHHR